MKVKLNLLLLSLLQKSVSQVSDHSVDIRLRRLFSLFKSVKITFVTEKEKKNLSIKHKN